MTKTSFGKTSDGQPVELYVLTNARGMQASITNYGGIITKLMVPDRDGKLADVVLGFDSLDGYLQGHPYFGIIVGHTAIASPRDSSPWTAKRTNWHATTRKTTCTVASRDSTRPCGRPAPRWAKRAQGCGFPTPAPTATRAIRARCR